MNYERRELKYSKKPEQDVISIIDLFIHVRKSSTHGKYVRFS